MHTCSHTHTTYTHACIHMLTHATHTYIHMHKCSSTYSYTHAYMHAYTSSHTHNMHTCLHTHVQCSHTLTACTHKHTHMYKQRDVGHQFPRLTLDSMKPVAFVLEPETQEDLRVHYSGLHQQ